MLRRRAELLSLELEFAEFTGKPTRHRAGTITTLPVEMNTPVAPGQPDPSNAEYIIATLARAVDGCLAGEFAAMVTGPVNKAIINQGGYTFSGHTEYVAERCNNAFPVMMLMDAGLRVALVTTHLPLAEVPATINSGLVNRVVRTVHHDLIHRFGIGHPHLLVCGINPHAGEQGYLGREEIDTVIPVLQQLRDDGLQITGPVPADTAFTPASLLGKDAVIAMFHDQGLPVLKSRGFGEIVNITLGLPILRTSVDHGTALDLAATGKASDTSLKAAVETAIQLAARDN